MKRRLFNSKLVLILVGRAETLFLKEFLLWLERNLGVKADYDRATFSFGRPKKEQLISEGSKETNPFENKLTFRVAKKDLKDVFKRFQELGCGQLSSSTGDLVAVSIWKNRETVMAWICLDTREVKQA